MTICLKNYAKCAGATREELTSVLRMPEHIQAESKLVYDFEVRAFGHYYLLDLRLQADLLIHCQRCLSPFSYHYDKQSMLAVCEDDAVAENLMQQFECIVAPQYQLDLSDVIADELHLHAPERHLTEMDCDPNMVQFMNCHSTLLDCL